MAANHAVSDVSSQLRPNFNTSLLVTSTRTLIVRTGSLLKCLAQAKLEMPTCTSAGQAHHVS